MRNLFFIVGLAFLFLLHPFGSASASVSISFTAGTIRGANGLPVDLNSIGVLVADTAHTGFGTAATLPGSTLLVSSTLGGPGIIILQVFFAEDLGGGLIGFNGTANYDAALVPPGTSLAFYWFPSITAAGGIIPTNTSMSYGFYRTDLIDLKSGSEMAFIAPSDGSNSALAVFDNILFPGSLASSGALTASNTTTIPFTVPPIGPQETGAPQLTMSDSNVYLTVKSSVSGRKYQLQFSDDLTPGSWTDTGLTQTGNGSDLTISTLRSATVSRRFYRLKLI